MYEVYVTAPFGSWVEKFETYEEAYEYAGEMFGIGFDVSSPDGIAFFGLICAKGEK